MEIFLQILAVIGIILLCIIGLILLVLGLVLFVPVRYKIKAHKATDVVAQIQATWLLHFLSIKYIYPSPGEIVVRIFGAKVWKMKLGTEENKEPEDINVPTEKEISGDICDSEVKNKKSDSSQPETNEKKILPEDMAETSQTSESDSVKENESDKAEMNVFEKIQYKIKGIYDKIKKICTNYKYYKDLLQEKENRLLFERCKMRLLKILKHIKPKVLKADMFIGTGEPDSTGYLMAVYGMLIPILGNNINITPDFDNKIFEGQLYAKGRITVFTLLYNAVKIYFDDQLHLLIDKMKRKDV